MAATKKTTEKKAEAKDKSGRVLVIVESPAKSKTIKKILGDNYDIEASYGHIRDLPTKVLGFDINDGFKPTFEIIAEKQDVVNKLNTLAKKASKVLLASDPDREGEAIAWHVKEVLKVPEDKIQRIEFNEITPKAIIHAVETPREIDINRVKAQQTRQILDKLVGYTISPILWVKMGNRHLSAGRVQSVALRLIVEREEEIEKFIPVEYWSMTGLFNKDSKKFEAELSKYKDKKIEIHNKEEADKIVADLTKPNVKFEVAKITNRETQRKPSAPFITSTLQREASSKLGYGVSKTMQVAQKLYEGIDIGADGPVGLITYMRTDSMRISDDAQAAAKDFITDNYGEKYYPKTPNNYVKAGKKNIQDAHEAIRPSYVERTPESIKKYLTPEQYKLYKLIWDRFISSQMENATVANKTVDIQANDYTFKVGASKVIFDGFLKVYSQSEDDEPKGEEEQLLDNKIPDFEKGDVVKLEKLDPKQHFTQPPPRYSEASLVKALEEYGIGRPSTYAPIISKIQQKNYVEKIDKALVPTLLGKALCKQLIQHFTDIMNYEFTANMETKLDDIAEEKLIWNKVLQDFYDPFSKTVDSAKENMGRVLIDSGKVCPNCGKPMVVRTSRFNTQFLGCSGYPECKTIMSLDGELPNAQEPEKSEEKCEKCNSEMVIKNGRYGKYLECTNESCKNRKSIVISSGIKCPNCGKGELVQRKSRFGKIFWGCNNYPDCKTAYWGEPLDEKCPDCGALLIKRITTKVRQIACSNKECKYTRELEDDGQEN